jgi:hypothetical protein
MPTNIKVFGAKDFLHVTPQGQVHLAKSLRVVEEIAAATANLDDFEVLIDVRRTKGALTPNELWTLAQQLLKHKRTFAHRTAILCPFEKFDRAEFFAMCAEQHGFNIQAFTSYQDAMEWLLEPGGASRHS